MQPSQSPAGDDFGSCKDGVSLITQGLQEVRDAGFLPEELLLGLVEAEWARVEAAPGFAGGSKTFQQLQLLAELVRAIESFAPLAGAPSETSVPKTAASSPDAFYSPEEQAGGGCAGASTAMATAQQHLLAEDADATGGGTTPGSGSEQTTSPMQPQRLSFRTSSGGSSASTHSVEVPPGHSSHGVGGGPAASPADSAPLHVATTPFVDAEAGGGGSSDEDEGGMDYYEDDGWIVPDDAVSSEGSAAESSEGSEGGDEDSDGSGEDWAPSPAGAEEKASSPGGAAQPRPRAGEGGAGVEEDEDEPVVYSVHRRGGRRPRAEVVIDSSDDDEGEPAEPLPEGAADEAGGGGGGGQSDGGGSGGSEDDEDVAFRGRRGARSRRVIVDSDEDDGPDEADGAAPPVLVAAPAASPSPRQEGSSLPPGRAGRGVESQVIVLSDSDSDEDGGGGRGCIVWSTVKKVPARRRRIDDSPEPAPAEATGDDGGLFSSEPLRALADDLAGLSISSTPRTPGPSTPAAFKRQKEELTRQLYSEYNREIFGGKLPAELEIRWNQTLKTTAGVTHFKRQAAERGYRHTAWVELSTKVLDSHDRLRRTLCHELCHVAAWLLDHVAKPPHGAVFKKWASRAMARYPDLDITTCHQYEIFFKFRWRCVNAWCLREYGRHSNSIDPERQGCGVCGGRLEFLGRFNQDGSRSASAKAPTAFALFVKENYADTKARNPGASHKDVMKLVSEAWKRRKPLAESN